MLTSAAATGVRSTAPAESGTEARIGPNAIIQTVAALNARFGLSQGSDILAKATGLMPHQLPTAMVDEAEVQALVRRCLLHIGDSETREVLRDAGERTGDYLLAHRIPRVVQSLLRVLPPPLALRLLARAMAQHAWTFVGSGRFVFTMRAPPEFAIHNCPFCRGLSLGSPVCDFYAGTFERLLDTLVRGGTLVTQVESSASGGNCCRYVVTWSTDSAQIVRPTAPATTRA